MASSTIRKAPLGYSHGQIALHWTIVVLVIVQLVSHEGMEHAFDRFEDAGFPAFPWDALAAVHAVSGAAILLLMLARIAVRVRKGAPPLPADIPRVQQLAAHASHYALYGLLVVLPLTGVAAVFGGSEAAADLHSLLVSLLWIVVIVHVLAAIYHAVIRRDGVFQRIIIPGR